MENFDVEQPMLCSSEQQQAIQHIVYWHCSVCILGIHSLAIVFGYIALTILDFYFGIMSHCADNYKLINLSIWLIVTGCIMALRFGGVIWICMNETFYKKYEQPLRGLRCAFSLFWLCWLVIGAIQYYSHQYSKTCAPVSVIDYFTVRFLIFGVDVLSSLFV